MSQTHPVSVCYPIAKQQLQKRAKRKKDTELRSQIQLRQSTSFDCGAVLCDRIQDQLNFTVQERLV
jgi:hypothetical protein